MGLGFSFLLTSRWSGAALISSMEHGNMENETYNQLGEPGSDCRAWWIGFSVSQVMA